MAAAPVSASRAIRRRTDWVWAERVDGVDLAVAVAVGLAWLALLGHDLGPAHHHGPLGLMAGWLTMVVAMMGPAVLPAMRHVAVSSLRWRRTRAVLEFTAVYVAVWLVFGALALTVLSAVTPSARLVALALAAAAGWQLSGHKRQFLQRCHRAVPLAPTGVRATLACARFGWVHATACVGSCWAVMTVMAAAPSSHLLWGTLLTPVVLHERTAVQPGRAARQSAAALLATAALLLTASRIW